MQPARLVDNCTARPEGSDEIVGTFGALFLLQRSTDVEYHSVMEINLIPIHPESGRCPRCGHLASFRPVNFDARIIQVNCSGGCPNFTTSKPRLDDA
jgi:hypothetical protein